MPNPNEGQYRISGIYGSAYRNGQLLADVVEVLPQVEIGRITVPVVGSRDEGTKMGRATREGSMRIHKIDSTWELEVYAILAQSDDDRRKARDAGNPIDPRFSLVLKLDDPEALGVERWQLDGVRLWRLPLGFNIADEITEREYPITWETERPLTAFKKGVNAQTGRPVANYVYNVR